MRCFFHLVHDHDSILDEEGVEVSGFWQVQAQARQAIRQLQQEESNLDETLKGWQLDVVDALGSVLLSMPWIVFCNISAFHTWPSAEFAVRFARSDVLAPLGMFLTTLDSSPGLFAFFNCALNGLGGISLAPRAIRCMIGSAMSPMWKERKDLAEVDVQVAEEERRLAQQITLIQWMAKKGQDTEEATKLLWRYQQDLEQLRWHRQLILDEISRLERSDHEAPLP